jgi:hypothetical protein
MVKDTEDERASDCFFKTSHFVSNNDGGKTEKGDRNGKGSTVRTKFFKVSVNGSGKKT